MVSLSLFIPQPFSLSNWGSNLSTTKCCDSACYSCEEEQDYDVCDSSNYIENEIRHDDRLGASAMKSNGSNDQLYAMNQDWSALAYDIRASMPPSQLYSDVYRLKEGLG